MGDDEAFAELERRAREGAVWRYGKIDETVEARLQKELAIIRDKGFAHYFLVVEEIAKQSERTCGRGSAAASLVAYCLGITHVDPIRHNLFFERFLNEGRTDPPDIDIDFPWDERDAILDFAFARYGAKRAAMVANQVGFKGRAALREVAKVYGLPEAEIKEVTERISGFWKADSTAGAVNDHPLFQGEKLAAGLAGDHRRRAAAERAAAPPVAPLRRAGDRAGRDPALRPGGGLEEGAADDPVGKGPGRGRGAGEDRYPRQPLPGGDPRCHGGGEGTYGGIEIDYASWQPLEDAKTRTLLRRGVTMGCFYVESPSIRLLLRKIWGEHPVPAGAAGRPVRGAGAGLLHHQAGRQHLHPGIRGAAAGERMGAAPSAPGGGAGRDVRHRHLPGADHADRHGAGRFFRLRGGPAAQDHQQEAQGKEAGGLPAAVLCRRGAKRVCRTTVLEATWEQILSFAGYSFCKPHSASYALVSAKAAYLKANHPAEFMAAVISNQGGYYSAFAYISECRRLGLTILPPDINESDYALHAAQDKEVRVGLMQIAGLDPRRRRKRC